MAQLSLIQALTGNIPGQGANGNGGQGRPESAQGGSGTILFTSLLDQQLTGTASALPQSGLSEIVIPADGSPDGASTLLEIPAGVAAGQSLLTSVVFNPKMAGDPGIHDGLNGAVEGQALFGLVDRAETEAARAAENSPVLAAVLADDGSSIFAAGPNEQNIPAPFLGNSPDAATGRATVADIADGLIIGQLPAQASETAALASGKVRSSAAAPTPGDDSDIDIALAIAPNGESIAAAVKGFGPSDTTATPPSTVTRGDAVPLDVVKAARAESDGQARTQLAPKAGAETQSSFAGGTGGSGDLDGDGEQNSMQNETGGKKGLGAKARDISAPGRGIKTSGSAGHGSSNNVAQLPVAGQSPNSLQLHLTPLRALENSMALNAGLILPFAGTAPVDPMTGMQTSMSAQLLATGIQALQAGASVSSAAQGAASLAHSPNFVANQVGLHITRAIADGNNEFTIRLNPPELGRVEVRLEFAADGGVRAALSAERPETLNLLQRDAAALERALNDAGVKTDSGSLNFSLQRDEAEAGEQGSNGAGDLAAAGEEVDPDYPSEVEIEITEQIIQQMVADGAVDIRV